MQVLSTGFRAVEVGARRDIFAVWNFGDFRGGDGVGICGFGDKASTPVQSVEMDGCRVDCETLAALRRDGTKNAMAVTVKQ